MKSTEKIIKVRPVIKVCHSYYTNVFDFSMAVFLILNYIYYFVTARPIVAQLRMIPLLICALLGACQFYKKKISQTVLLFMAIFILNWVVVSLAKSDEWIYGFNYFKYTLCYMCTALGLLSDRHIVFPYKFCFYLVHFYILFQLIILNKDVGSIIKAGASYNYISVYCLFYFVLYIVVLTDNKKEPKPFDFFLFFGVCLVGRGRGTIVVGFAAIVLYFAVVYIRQTNRQVKLFLVVMALSILPFLYRYGSSYIDAQGYLEKFDRLGLSSNGRWTIWLQYVSSCLKSPFSFLLGASPGFMGADGNLHNEFFQVWASFGFLMLVSFIVLCVCVTNYLAKKRHYYLLICFVLLIIRGFTDKIFFYGNCEICLFYLLFFYLTDRRKLSEKSISELENAN